MRESASDRQDRIVSLVRAQGRVQLPDLAEHLGVSLMTVRRDVDALDQAGRLRRKHGYVLPPASASEAAASPGIELAGQVPEGRGLTLGLVVPSAERYYPDVIKGVRAVAAAAGARLVLGLTLYQPEQDAVQIERLLDAGIDGLIIAPIWETGTARGAEAERVLDLGLPTVLLERRASVGTAADDLDRVCTDHAHGAAVAVRHLASLGHEQILFAAPPSPTTPGLARGYREVRETLSLPEPVVGPIEFGGDTSDPVVQQDLLTGTLAAIEAGITALVVHDDTHAMLLSQMLLARGVKIPGDVSMIAYDDEVAALADIPLTAVVPPKREVGDQAGRLLLERLAARRGAGPSSSSPRHIDLLPTLRVRESCGARVA
ncbi:LacI family DNA-binding transcriptional regulator [Actinospica durhamensis]|uniref:LacI family DNA-binding transcriptional regulator n=1 Tax=Actinospica durhamensis TaxID=1508375 RepID=A0A941ISY6_9ACTN|nr:LacI family DNA-binding transcriptional regulator [Actinospica durhamensis]MBR7836952.1 LacI family DNA-binding transcriptional regulator [Actinospica durhamensis]